MHQYFLSHTDALQFTFISHKNKRNLLKHIWGEGGEDTTSVGICLPTPPATPQFIKYTPHPTLTPHPTRVTLLPASHCGHSGHSYVSSPSSNIPSQRNRLFARKNGVQTLISGRVTFNVAHYIVTWLVSQTYAVLSVKIKL